MCILCVRLCRVGRSVGVCVCVCMPEHMLPAGMLPALFGCVRFLRGAREWLVCIYIKYMAKYYTLACEWYICVGRADRRGGGALW